MFKSLKEAEGTIKISPFVVLVLSIFLAIHYEKAPLWWEFVTLACIDYQKQKPSKIPKSIEEKIK